MRPRSCIPRPPPHAPTPFRARTPLAHFPCSFAPSAEHPRPLSRPARAPRQFYRSSWFRCRYADAVESPTVFVALVSSALSPATWNAP
ncbi:hypothetical protein Zm00014a_028185 [Zea mays]|uniref:Uncharacterized protein n=1 Tax=Zea mays TaxID=4577 RepID=A0A317YDV8_MAIZE|nr:hypothetical protein Zm00014a_028185 [Zea mays]